jgi:hypothetical protein
VKVTKSQLKELIRHTIVDLTEKTFGSKAQYDAYRKKHNLKPGSKHKVDGKTVTVRDVKKISKSAAKSADKFAAAQNAKLDAAEKAMKKKKVKESKMKRYTVKEVRMWMKKLEENRYKKVYNSDARRVAWMVNNEGVELSEMPKSMSKKWTKAQYGRERYLATEFLKSKSEQMTEGKLTEKSAISLNLWIKEFERLAKKNRMKPVDFIKKHISKRKGMDNEVVKDVLKHFQKNEGKLTSEQKLRESIREIIKEQLNEVKFKKVILPNDMKTKVKVSKMIKQLKLKIDKDYDVKALKARGGDQVISILPKHYNKFIELAMQNKLNPRG